MAYAAYPIAKATPPYGDIYHDHVPVIVTTVVEYEDMLGQHRQDFGCSFCNDADPLVITLGRTRCGVWLEADVLLDEVPRRAEELIGAFDLEGDWFWDWEQDYHGAGPPDQAALQTPHQVRRWPTRPLRKEQLVVDYFRWRQDDAMRCALHGWCYWTLRRTGKNVQEATRMLRGASVADKNELLFQHGINFNELPAWQRRGTGLYWETYTKEGLNPKQQQIVRTTRRRINIDRALPMKDGYAQWLRDMMRISRVPAHDRRENLG